MKALDILNYMERSFMTDYFVDLHIINNSVVGFYKTHTVKRRNQQAYLFPITCSFANGKLHTTMTFGSVQRNFILPRNDEIIMAQKAGVDLNMLTINNHIYKLLTAQQNSILSSDIRHDSINVKAFMAIILGLANIDFPFIRIAISD